MCTVFVRLSVKIRVTFMKYPAYTLVNPGNGNLAFKLFHFNDNVFFDHVQRHNYYSVIWIKEGRGVAKIDFAEYEFKAGEMFFLAPYQPYMFDAAGTFNGMALNFHPDFFCIYNHQKEVDCNGVLFHNLYDPPMQIPQDYVIRFNELAEQIIAEIQNTALAQNDLLVSLLKIWLVYATRIKAEQKAITSLPDIENNKELQMLQQLKDAIEENYRSKHSASDYACILNISTKALGKAAKKHFNKTLTSLISERIITEAKRELYLTGKPVKEIAYELGFEDEYYFSRFFKNYTDVSPKMYRETVLPYPYSLQIQ